MAKTERTQLNFRTTQEIKDWLEQVSIDQELSQTKIMNIILKDVKRRMEQGDKVLRVEFV